MKRALLVTLAASVVLVLVGRGFLRNESEPEAKGAAAAVKRPSSPTALPIAQDYAMVRAILNASPAQVAKVLGAADGPIRPTRDCDYLPSCSETTYQHKKFEALFFGNRLKWLSVNRTGLMTEDLPWRFGFPSYAPTWYTRTSSGETVSIDWRSAEARGTAKGPLFPINGIRKIMACEDFAQIEVATNYDRPL